MEVGGSRGIHLTSRVFCIKIGATKGNRMGAVPTARPVQEARGASGDETQSKIAVPTTLNSWKEIAVYMQAGIRTLQRWELELGMPIHRFTDGSHSRVFAFAKELDLWTLSRAEPRGHRRELHRQSSVKAMELRMRATELCEQSRALQREVSSQLTRLQNRVAALWKISAFASARRLADSTEDNL